MDIGASADSFDCSHDGKSMIYNINNNQNSNHRHIGDDDGSEWVLYFPFFSTISEYILKINVLSVTANIHMKARFVESFFFTFFLFFIVLSAAAPHIVIF